MPLSILLFACTWLTACVTPGPSRVDGPAAAATSNDACAAAKPDGDPSCNLGLGGATSGSHRPAASAPTGPGGPAQGSGWPKELAPYLRPWHKLEPSAAERASTWLVARYFPSTYPCVAGPGDSLDMLEQSSFRPEEVLRGVVRSLAVDLPIGSLSGPAFPRAFAEGRRYLLLLKPERKSAALLAQPDAIWSMADQLLVTEVIAILDLSQSGEEARAEQVDASRNGEHDGYRLDPARWAALRNAADVDASEHRKLVAFLRAKVLVRGAQLADVRAWLGSPDRQTLDQRGARRAQYILSKPRNLAPQHGTVYGALELRYDSTLTLRSYRVEYLRWRVEPKLSSSRALNPTELAQLGLPGTEQRLD